MSRFYRSAGEEPELDEIFADPIIHAVMRRDGVSREALCRVIQTARLALGLVPEGVVPLPCAPLAKTPNPDRVLRMRCG
jgi:hypothetical protein